MIFAGDRVEVDRYLLAVDQIQQSMSSASISDDQSKVNSAIQIAMARLEDEFRDILLTHTSTTLESDSLTDPSSSNHSAASSTSGGAAAGEFEDDNDEDKVEEEFLCQDDSSNSLKYRSTSSIREIDLIPSDAVINLRSVAERMISVGYLRECIQVYGSVRKSAVDSSFKRLGIEKLSIGDIQRLEWDQLGAKIRRWIRAAKICIRIVFASEKNLCEQILDLIPDIDVVFESKSSESIRIQGAEILSRLAEAARGILSEFENAVLREPSRVPVTGGTIHPLTRYVMNYISLISDYKQTLNELIVSKPPTGSRYSNDPSTPDMEFTELEGKIPLSLHLIWIIEILQLNWRENLSTIKILH